jgi:hypothetical protein
MLNKRFWLGMSVIVLVFGMTVFGCASTGPKINYYNLGDVSEINCALIEVSPVYQIYDQEKRERLKSQYPFSNFVKIDGQGDDKSWQPPPEGFFIGKSIVRVTPGIHTFTLTFFYNDEYEVPVDITYDCKAGKGYSFEFLVHEQLIILGQGMGMLASAIIIKEADVDEKGNFGGLATPSREVAKKTENLNFNASELGVDKGRLVKRNK